MFEPFVLDVGFRWKGSKPVWRVALPDDLVFAGVGSFDIGTVPVEFQIAENVRAYMRTFGPGRTGSRTKDLVDLVLIARTLGVGTAKLRVAIDEIFA